jgi:hypothetical protein
VIVPINLVLNVACRIGSTMADASMVPATSESRSVKVVPATRAEPVEAAAALPDPPATASGDGAPQAVASKAAELTPKSARECLRVARRAAKEVIVDMREIVAAARPPTDA